MVAELIDGELFLHPRPAKPHAVTASNLGSQLNMAFDLGRTGPGGWWIIYEPELHWREQVLVPDVAGWPRADVPELDLERPYFDETPAWIAEVLSPGNERHDRVKKLRIYAAVRRDRARARDAVADLAVVGAARPRDPSTGRRPRRALRRRGRSSG
jgi:Uma2 family endonuclease